MDMKFLDHIGPVHAAAEALILEKGRTYGASWKKRGGRGAWYTLVRPMDRLQKIVEEDHGGDIFAAIEAEPGGGDGTALDAVRDLRNYLTLVEAEMMARQAPDEKVVPTFLGVMIHPGTPEDGGHHAAYVPDVDETYSTSVRAAPAAPEPAPATYPLPTAVQDLLDGCRKGLAPRLLNGEVSAEPVYDAHFRVASWRIVIDNIKPKA